MKVINQYIWKGPKTTKGSEIVQSEFNLLEADKDTLESCLAYPFIIIRFG